MKIRATVFQAIRDFFTKKDYHDFTPPIFTPNACEGGATLFEVDYFGDKVYLTQSWQLYAEAAIAALDRIFCIGPCFRSGKSKTSRHLSSCCHQLSEGDDGFLQTKGYQGIRRQLSVLICLHLGGYGELMGGSQRDIDIVELKRGLKAEGEDIKNYQWYLDTRRYGNVPHSGFGMGVERLIVWICGLDNIKDAIHFPRTMLRKNP